MKRLPFRLRLTLWSTIVAGVALIICGSVAVYLGGRKTLTELDENLKLDAEHFFAEMERHGGATFDWSRIDFEAREWLNLNDKNLLVEISMEDKVLWHTPRLSPIGFQNTLEGLGNQLIEGRKYRVIVMQKLGVRLAIGKDAREVTAMHQHLIFGLLAGLPFALAFAWLGGRRLAGFAVKPLQAMTEATAEISAEQLYRRVPVPSTKDEIQRHAEVLNAKLDQLERSYNQALRFSADASHELKTPLTVMRSTIEAVLESPALPDAERRAIASLLVQTKRLSDITSSLLLLARADAGLLKMNCEPQDLVPLTEELVEDATIMADAKNISMQHTLPAQAPCQVDRLRFSQILSNLLGNAVKYTESGGKIELVLAEGDSCWVMRLANSGSPISAEHAPRLFDRFFRAGQSSDVLGHGLGLSLAKELAHAHGGQLSLSRNTAEWTEFTLTLPK